ncbi:septum site-determining protein MinC [Moraxella bovis]|uniref:Probable septum site-determining protein MinC n=1 Tax=Moraxella bovis TaxID=476 RepID=A0A378PUI0_MORBO|nr:septum site-determining protein MinC [Moraxella bovis]STY90412.1 Septum site-determining protein MinC [Moraxella bovis]
MKPITLFGKMLSFSRLKLHTDDLTAIQDELSVLLKDNTSVPVVLDSECKLDLSVLVEMLWQMGVQPIGVVDGVLSEQANALRLATFPADGKRMERIKPTDSRPTSIKADDTNNAQSSESRSSEVKPSGQAGEPTNQPTAQKEATATQTQTAPLGLDIADNTSKQEQGVTSSVHSQMLRSGQSLQHLGGDLIVIGGVNKGAEAITDNSLHIYGHGQGRLVAGATGDKEARIFCQKFNPTLVSVAGTYCLSDAIPPEMIDKAVQVRYDEKEGLVFTLMTM